MKDKISIITTFYNSEKYILQCIHSVNSQIINDLFEVEYILVNDNSEDQTLDIINAYFSKLKNKNINVRIIKTFKNSGAGYSRKLGIKNATGNYMMFLDSDDYYINNNFLLKAYNAIKEHDADIIEFGYLSTNGETYERIKTVSGKIIVINDNKLINMRSLFFDGLINFMPWTKIIKTSLVICHEWSNSRTFDDIETVPYWIYNANKIVIMNSVEINYRCSENSLFKDNPIKVRLEALKAICTLFESFKDNIEILKIMYERALSDLRELMKNDSNDQNFIAGSQINKYMLSYIYPETYKNITYEIENDNNK